MKKFDLKSKQGFTLIELLVVIGILAVLAAIAIPTVAGLIDRANVSADKTNSNEMTNAVERFTSEYELYCQDIASGKIKDATNLDSAQARVYNVTKALSRSDIEKLESEDGFNGRAIDEDTKYPVNADTMQAVVQAYTKTSSATFEPKQSDMHYWYSPDCGIVVFDEPDASKSDLNAQVVSGKDASGKTLDGNTEWIDITLSASLSGDGDNQQANTPFKYGEKYCADIDGAIQYIVINENGSGELSGMTVPANIFDVDGTKIYQNMGDGFEQVGTVASDGTYIIIDGTTFYLEQTNSDEIIFGNLYVKETAYDSVGLVIYENGGVITKVGNMLKYYSSGISFVGKDIYVYTSELNGKLQIIDKNTVVDSNGVKITNKGIANYKIVDGAVYSNDGKTLLCYDVQKNNVEYVIPNGTTKIGDFAFNKTTSVKSIRIPATVTHIGDNNFIECNNLTDIYFEGTQEQWNAFDYLLEDNITLHILK